MPFFSALGVRGWSVQCGVGALFLIERGGSRRWRSVVPLRVFSDFSPHSLRDFSFIVCVGCPSVAVRFAIEGVLVWVF